MVHISCGGGDDVRGLIQYEPVTDGKDLLFWRGLGRGLGVNRNGIVER